MAVGQTFSKLFGRSPISQMQEHMAKVQTAAAVLPTFIEHALAGNWEEAAKQRKQIVKLENEADDLKKQLRLQLPKSMFLPVPRTDLLSLLAMQDQIANRTKDISGIMIGRKMCFPSEMAEPITSFVDLSVSATSQAFKAIEELDELLETSFRGQEINVVEKLLTELDEIESRADSLEVEIRAQLFALEKDLYPVDVMFLYRVIDWIGDLADRAQKVGSRLQILIAR